MIVVREPSTWNDAKTTAHPEPRRACDHSSPASTTKVATLSFCLLLGPPTAATGSASTANFAFTSMATSRGGHCVDGGYLDALRAASIGRSMSRAGNGHDNAALESFWRPLKSATGLAEAIPVSRHQTALAVFDYIETLYIRKRRHSSLGWVMPMVFTNKYAKPKPSRLNWSSFFRGKPISLITFAVAFSGRRLFR